MRKNYLLAAACFCAAFSYSQNALQLGWDFNGNSGNELSVVASSNNVNLETSVISRGAGLSAASLANSFSAGGWTITNSLSDAITNNDYFQFTTKAKSSFVTSLSFLEVVFRRSSTGPDHFQWQYSVGGALFLNIGSEIIYTNTTTNGLAQLPIDLSSISALQSVPSSITIIWRLYGYNASAAGGTFSIGRLPGNDLAITGTTQSITPVTLLNFSVVTRLGFAELSWKTATEINSDRYVIEHSTDGKTFKKMAVVLSKNNSNGSTYFFRDSIYRNGRNFYRLRMIDFDGRDWFTQIVNVDSKKLVEVEVFPNPVQNVLTIRYPGINSPSALCIMGMDGRIYRRFTLAANSSLFNITIDHLLSGQYIVTWSNEAGIYSSKFYKQ